MFYSHVNYSVTKITVSSDIPKSWFYSHVNYSVTKICKGFHRTNSKFYSHVNYSVTKIGAVSITRELCFTVT